MWNYKTSFHKFSAMTQWTFIQFIYQQMKVTILSLLSELQLQLVLNYQHKNVHPSRALLQVKETGIMNQQVRTDCPTDLV